MYFKRSLARILLLSGLIGFASPQSESLAQDQATRVVTSIKPIHSLVSGVLSGTGQLELLIEGASSPHTYSLKPSQARSLQEAEIIFWVGEELEVFLVKPLASLGSKARTVALEDVPGLTKLPFREGGAFDAHEHHDGHEDHEDHEVHEAHEAHEAHDSHAKHDSDNHADMDGHEELDPHVWLDPVNAEILVLHIASIMSDVDPDNAELYAANASAMQNQLKQLRSKVEELLKPVRHRPFVVFHDAYHYFENRFGLEAAGSLTINPDTTPGVARLTEIKEKLNNLEAACIFSEPQFPTRITDVVREGTSAKAGILDPLGAELEKGPELYFQLIRNMADSFHDCLASGS